jgi:hypothetical protein
VFVASSTVRKESSQMVQWQPLHQRGAGPRYVEHPDQPLHEGVPPHLREPLQDWLQLNVKADVLASITARVQVDAGVLRQRAQQRKRSSYVLPHEILFELVGGDPAGLLDVVDLVLSEGPRFGAPQVRKIDRRGGVRPTQPPTLEAAQAAVQLAVMLVPWFTTGAVRKV